jgi:SAM-dependent methyltransferase
MKILLKILKFKPNSILARNKKVYDYSEKTENFVFYNNQFINNQKINIGEKIKNVDISKSPSEMIDINNFLLKNISSESVFVELGGSKYQRRSGFPYFFFKNYFPLDISQQSMIGYSELYDRFSISCNAETLPFKIKTIDVIMTHTFLEHPLNPNNVLKEIDRVLKKGGYVIHSDAWNCRWWQRFGFYGIKSFKDISLNYKLLYVIIFLYEIKLFRYINVVLKRFFKELFLSTKKPNKFIFKKLKPNYELNLFCDEDAASSIDPVDLIRFYKSRGYKLVPNLSFFELLFFNKKTIYLKKND